MALAEIGLHCIFDKLKLGIKSGAKVTLNLWSNVIGDSNDKTNFSHKLS